MFLNKFPALLVALSVTQSLYATSSSVSVSDHILAAEKRAALQIQLEVTQKEVALTEEETKLHVALKALELEKKHDLIALKDAELDKAYGTIDALLLELNKLTEMSNSMTMVPTSKPSGGPTQSKVAMPGIFVLETSIGGKAKPKARVQSSDGSVFLLREGSSIQGWRVSGISKGEIQLKKGENFAAYNSAGLIQ